MIPSAYYRTLSCVLKLYRLKADDFLAGNKPVVRPMDSSLSEDQLWSHLTEIGSKHELIVMRSDYEISAWQTHFETGSYPQIVLQQHASGPRFLVLGYPEKGKRSVSSFSAANDETHGNMTFEEFVEFLPVKNQLAVYTCYPDKPLFGKRREDSSGRWDLTYRLGQLLRYERRTIGYIMLYALVASIIGLSLPLGVQSIVSLMASGRIVTSVIVLIALIVIGLLLSGGLQIMQLYFTEYMQRRMFVRSAFAFAGRIPRMRLESIRHLYPPELVNRFFDIVTLQKGIASILVEFSSAMLQVIFGLLLLMLYHPVFIIVGIVIVCVLIIFIRLTGPAGLTSSIKESKYKYKIADWLEDLARSIHTFKTAGKSSLTSEKTESFLRSYLGARSKHFRVLVRQYIGFVVFKAAITAALLICGCLLVVNRQINLGQFIAAEIVVVLLMNSIEKIILKLDVVYDVFTSIDKLAQVTESPVDTVQTQGLILPIKQTGINLQLNKVSYQFDTSPKPTLQDFDLHIDSGERICITGQNGSGKTALLHTLTGSLTNWTGGIAFDGYSLRDLDPTNLHLQVGNYFTDAKLFGGTILENITLGRFQTTTDDVLEALRLVGLEAFIHQLPQGLHTEIASGANHFSLGVTCKILIARCIVHHPRLILLDSIFGALDCSEQQRILSVLLDPKQTWTVILVTSDPLLMQHFKRIVMLQEGQVVADANWETIRQHPTWVNAFKTDQA